MSYNSFCTGRKFNSGKYQGVITYDGYFSLFWSIFRTILSTFREQEKEMIVDI